MRVLTMSAVALVATVVLPQPVSGQETSVYGQVVLADDPRVEIARARIAIGGAGAQAASFVFADDHGQFQVVAPRAASLTITRSGFLPVTLKVAGAASSLSTPATVKLTRAAAVSGRLVDLKGEPVVGGGVRLWRTDDGAPPGSRSMMTTFTNDLGEFRVGGLAAGKYEISSYHDFDEQARIRTNDEMQSGLLRLQRVTDENRAIAARVIGEPQLLSDVTPIEISAGADAQVTLRQALSSNRDGLRGSGAIAGAVIDAFGEPVERVRVRAWRTSGSGRLPAQQTGAAAVTDDRGQFRLFHLPPGAYVVEVLPASQQPSAPAMGPLYYPGTSLVGQASFVSVDADEAASHLTINYVPSPLVSLYGIAVDAAGMPIRGVVGLIATSSGNGVRLAARTTQTAADGSFAFSSVAPGEYVVRATLLRGDDPRSPLGIMPAEFGLQRVFVNDVNVGPVRLTTSPTAKLLGRIEFEGTPPSTPADFGIRAIATDPERTTDSPLLRMTSTVSPNSDWTFEIRGLMGMTVLNLEGAPAGWWLKAIRTPITLPAGEPFDVSSDIEVVLVLSNASARVTGRVLPNAMPGIPLVIAFSTDEGQWRNGSSYIRYVHARSQDRTFAVQSLPPGEYFLVAIANADIMPEDDELTALLQALVPLSKRINLVAGDAQGHDLAPVALRK